MDIKTAFQLAEQEKSKIPHEYITKLTGLSSPKVWHLLNNLCLDKAVYLEVGTYMGSSLLAATYGHNIKPVAIDNFCMKPTTRNHFFQNVKHMKNLQFIENDCFKVDINTIPKVDTYFFDGEHTFDAQYKGLVHFIDAMHDEFIYIVDDWNNSPVREGTYKAIEDLKLTVLEFEERKFTTMKDKAGWWCGIVCFKLKKA